MLFKKTYTAATRYGSERGPKMCWDGLAPVLDSDQKNDDEYYQLVKESAAPKIGVVHKGFKATYNHGRNLWVGSTPIAPAGFTYIRWERL